MAGKESAKNEQSRRKMHRRKLEHREDNRRKVSENIKGSEGDTSKGARERQRKELRRAAPELFFSSSACCSLVLHWRVLQSLARGYH